MTWSLKIWKWRLCLEISFDAWKEAPRVIDSPVVVLKARLGRAYTRPAFTVSPED